MALKVLDNAGAQYILNKIKELFVQKETGKLLTSNDFTNAFKTKLQGIETGAQVNEVSASDLSAHTGATGDVHNIGVATTETNGLLSGADKTKIDAIPASPLYTDTVTTINGKTGVINKSDIVALGIPGQDTTYNPATTTINGLLTSTDKTKINSIESNAQVNVIESIQRNGTILGITSKSVNIAVPTKYSDLTDDKDYMTRTEIMDELLDKTVKFKFISTLPASPPEEELGKPYIYFVPIGESGKHGEYIWDVAESKWELLGSIDDIDLTDYLKTSDLVAITNLEIDAMFAL